MTRDEIVSEIQRLSCGGVAPLAYRHRWLAEQARRQFGSWRAACRAAGVLPANRIPRVEFTPPERGPRTPSRRLRQFAFLLAVARRSGHVTSDMIDCCMRAVARGELDPFFDWWEEANAVSGN